MPSGTSMVKFQHALPDRFFDVGIAEQHAVTFAAGLADSRDATGVRDLFNIFQRAYDQIIHDVCIQRLPVVFALDRAGFAGDDGRTHHGIVRSLLSRLYSQSGLDGSEKRKRIAPHGQNGDRF